MINSQDFKLSYAIKTSHREKKYYFSSKKLTI